MLTLTKKLPTAEVEDGMFDDLSSIESEFTPDKNEWECVMSIKREMSWGMATVHIQRKIV